MVLAILGTLALVGACVGIGLWIDRRVSILPRPEELQEAARKKLPGADHAAGTAPQTALRSDPEQIRRIVARQRCTCADRPAMIEESADDVRYGDKLLRVVRVRCPTCGASRALYFEPRA